MNFERIYQRINDDQLKDEETMMLFEFEYFYLFFFLFNTDDPENESKEKWLNYFFFSLDF